MELGGMFLCGYDLCKGRRYDMKKIFAIGIILLFVGVGVYPAIATKIDNTISKTLMNDGTLSADCRLL